MEVWIQSRQVTRADQFSPTVWALALNVMIRLTSQFILITSLSPITMGEAIVSSNYKWLQSMRVYITAGLLQRILFWEENRYLEENEIYVLQEVRWKLFSVFITVNKVHPPTGEVSESNCNSFTPQRTHKKKLKHPGGGNHRLDSAARTGGNDGQRRNMCWDWELNPSYRWQAHVSVEAHNRWHLTPLNSRSADIPLVSASRPIRIDCSASSLFHGQVIAGSSSSLTLMMLCINLRKLSVTLRRFQVQVRRSSSWCWSLIGDKKNTDANTVKNVSLILNVFHEVKKYFPLFL